MKEKFTWNYEYIIQSMNNAVCAEAEIRFNSMGCTAAMLMFFENHVYLSNLGDSPIFRFRGGKLEQISVDHTDAEMLKKQGITKRKPHLTQCVGISPEEMTLQPYYYEERTKIGDRYLICSDGLTDMVSKEEIAKTLFEMKEIEQCAEVLIQKALDGGGRDNITVLLVDIVDGEVSSNATQKLIPILREKKSVKKNEMSNHVQDVSNVPVQTDLTEIAATAPRAEVRTKSVSVMNEKPMKKNTGKLNNLAIAMLSLVVLVGVGFFCLTMLRKDTPKEESVVIDENIIEQQDSIEVFDEEVQPDVDEEYDDIEDVLERVVNVSAMDFDGDGNEDSFEYLVSSDEEETIVYLTISVNEFSGNLAVSCAYPLTEEDIIVSSGMLVEDKYSVVMQFVDSNSSYGSVEYHVITVDMTEAEMILKEELTLLDKKWEREFFEESYLDLGFGAIQSVSKDEVIEIIESLNINGIRIRQARTGEDTSDNEVFVYWAKDHWEVYGLEAYKNCIKSFGDWDKEKFDFYNETFQ